MHDREDAVTTRAILVLYFLDTKARSAVPALVRILQDPKRDAELRGYAALTLGRIADGDAQAVSALTAGLQDSVPSVRNIAISALGQCGPSARAAIPILFRLLSTPGDPQAQEHAADALRKISSAE